MKGKRTYRGMVFNEGEKVRTLPSAAVQKRGRITQVKNGGASIAVAWNDGSKSVVHASLLMWDLES